MKEKRSKPLWYGCKRPIDDASNGLSFSSEGENEIKSWSSKWKKIVEKKNI